MQQQERQPQTRYVSCQHAVAQGDLAGIKDPGVFKGSLNDVEETGVPQELHSVILWILKEVYTARMHALHRSASFVSQQVMQTSRSVFAAHSSSVPIWSITKEANALMVLYAVEALGDLGIVVHIYFQSQISRCIYFPINCRNPLNVQHVTVLRSSVTKPETSGSPLKVWTWRSIQRVKQYVTQIAEGGQQILDNRAYRTEAQHPDIHLPSLSMARLLCVNCVSQWSH